MTRAATALPRATPVVTSLGKATPATSRDCSACCAETVNASASSGSRYARMLDAAAATTACSDGYEGLAGVGRRGCRLRSTSPGCWRLYVYFASQAAIV